MTDKRTIDFDPAQDLRMELGGGKLADAIGQFGKELRSLSMKDMTAFRDRVLAIEGVLQEKYGAELTDGDLVMLQFGSFLVGDALKSVGALTGKKRSEVDQRIFRDSVELQQTVVQLILSNSNPETGDFDRNMERYFRDSGFEIYQRSE